MSYMAQVNYKVMYCRKHFGISVVDIAKACSFQKSAIHKTLKGDKRLSDESLRQVELYLKQECLKKQGLLSSFLQEF